MAYSFIIIGLEQGLNQYFWGANCQILGWLEQKVVLLDWKPRVVWFGWENDKSSHSWFFYQFITKYGWKGEWGIRN